jgi:hypothetical protein
VQNSKPINASASLFAILLLTLLFAMLALQTCSAQPTPPAEDKTLSFIRDVIQIDVNQYKITPTGDQSGVEKASLTVTLEPKTPSVSRGNYTIYIEFNSGFFTYFSITPDAGPLIYKQPRQDRFNETLGIIERYQTWLNDPQVGEMALLLRQVGSEKNVFQASGNLSLNIRLYADVGEYRFSNYISGVEYSGLCISQSQGGSILFTDNRGSQKIGNTTISISEDQAVAIAQEYFKTYPPRGGPGSKEITNLNRRDVKLI